MVASVQRSWANAERFGFARRVLHAFLGAAFGAVVLGLLVTVWGWDDVSAFFAHPARAAVGLILFIRALAAAWHPVLPSVGHGAPGKHVPEPGYLLLLCAVGAVGLASPWFDRQQVLVLPGGDGLRYAGLGCFLAGVSLATWAQHHLGRWFSGHLTIQPGHRLVTDGPFRYVRHPRYLGLMFLFTGLGLLFLSAVGLAGGLAFAWLLGGRVAREERMLAREFGADWLDYARRTHRLVPVWR